MQQPLYLQPLVAYREWRLVYLPIEKLFFMKSLYADSIWLYRKELGAEDRKSLDPGLNAAYDYGIYTVKSKYLEDKRGTLKGEAYIWGWIEEHIRGYRSQFAYPKSLLYLLCKTCRKYRSIQNFMENGHIYRLFDNEVYSFCDDCSPPSETAPEYYKENFAVKKVLDILQENYGITIIYDAPTEGQSLLEDF